jgi:hypothetical protein
LVVASHLDVGDGGTVGVEELDPRFERSENGIAVRHAKAGQELPGEWFLRKVCCSRRLSDVDADESFDWAVVGAIKTGEKCSLESCRNGVVVKSEEDIIYPIDEIDVVRAARRGETPEGIGAVDLDEAVGFEESLQSGGPALGSDAETVERAFEAPDCTRRAIIVFRRADVDLLVGVEGQALSKGLRHVERMNAPAVLSSKGENSANFCR